MSETLKQLFPNIRTEEAIIGEIKSDENLLAEYESWTELQQRDFLKFCSGMRGVKVLYDGFGKEILSPIYHPERLEELLSCILETEVKIRQVIPSDGTRIADEQSLVIMDIVVELMDGSLANVEIQRIGYLFPGERCACYSADLLLRQYKSVKSRKKRNFTYRDVKNVYTIVFIEKSTKEFQEFPNTYIHRAKQQFDTGLSVNLLQEYVLVPLDIFRKTTHNKIIENKLDAWLTFLSNDTSEKVKELVEKYPEFRDMYQEIYDICENVEEVVRMFSKELQELDRNTVLFVLLSILEDCGYMVRVAFVMDRIFRKFGLSGKSFIPLLISSGCGIPGIMASKTIENDNDRRLTIMTSTFVPCGAKLPVIALMAGVIGSEATGFPAGALTFIMYVIGVAAVLVSAIILKKTKPFHGDAAPFVMELPAYHLPQAKTVLIHTWERLKGFIRKAGTILLKAETAGGIVHKRGDNRWRTFICCLFFVSCVVKCASCAKKLKNKKKCGRVWI